MTLLTRNLSGVCEITLNRPERLNALTFEMTQQLVASVQQAMADDAVRALLLRGAGRGFCAGKDRDDPPAPAFVQTLQQLARALMNGGKPVVAAVHGWAVGAGVEMLLNCDVVVAARSARFMLPEINVGLFGTGGVAALLARHVGLGRAKGALMFGEEFSAAQAEQWGLVWSLVDEAEVGAEGLRLATRLAAKDASILARMKHLLHEEIVGDLDAVLARETRAQDALRRWG
jgi:2-(1,2-epoxy-1,2-dihydrophenyl)acetyl-CoA isomerase